MARNRYGWEKRAKEIARKQKHDEKLKRRQNKGREKAPEDAGPEEGTGVSESDNIPE